MKFQALRTVAILKSYSCKGDSSKEFCVLFTNTYSVEYLRMVPSESMYSVYIFLSEVRLEEEEEYKNYLRIASQCFDELFVLVKGDITK